MAITADILKTEYTGKVEKPRMLLPIFKQHNDDIKALVGNGFAHGTWVKFNTIYKHIETFLSSKYGIADINLKELNIEFFCDFEFYLRANKKIDLNTTAKYLQGLKKIVTGCVIKNWLDKNPSPGISSK